MDDRLDMAKRECAESTAAHDTAVHGLGEAQRERQRALEKVQRS